MKALPVFVFSLFVSSAALAQSPDIRARADFEASTGPVTVVSVQPPLPHAADYRATVAELDGNGDGVLVRSEVPVQHALASEFHLVDTNRNGRITQVELTNWK